MVEDTPDKESENFGEIIRKIRSILSQYSVEDISLSLLVSNLWLPNIASQVKHQLLYAVFVSTKIGKFSQKNKVNSYTDFRELMSNLYSILPVFPWIEDYVPELDWGEIKFHHNEKDFKIFYGNEIENVYDYLMLFQILYASRENDYLKLTKISPSSDLEFCISLQNRIISNIKSQPIEHDSLNVSPGHLEIPPENFWQEVKSFFLKFDPLSITSKNFVQRFTCDLGSLKDDDIQPEKFSNAVFEGTLLPFFFLRVNDKLVPILSRRFSSILLDWWAKIFKKHEKQLNEKSAYFFHISGEVYNFLKKRIRSKSLFPFVSAVKKNGKPHEILFSTSFISKDKLILIYTPAPFVSGEEIGNRLSQLASKLKDALELIGSPPVTLGLNTRRQIVKYKPDSNGEHLKPELFVLLSQTATQMQKIPLSKELPDKVVFLDQFLGMFDEIDEVDEIAEFLEYLEELEPKLARLPFGMLDKFASFKDSSGVLVGGAREPDMIMLDPHWGSNRRYKTLSEFWGKYPEGGFFDHPRSWKIESISEKSIRLIARAYFGSAICSQIGASRVFITTPFDLMSFHEGQITNLLIEALEDTLSRNEPNIDIMKIFQNFRQLQVNLFPLSLIEKNDLKHLKHLKPQGKLWVSDTGWVKEGIPGVRLVFDDKLVTESFEKAKDSSLEISLAIEILSKLNRFNPDSQYAKITEKLEKQKKNNPRFKLFKIRKKVSFPEFVSSYKPSIRHFKEAMKRVAEISKEVGLTPGEYKLDEAKIKLNLLRDKLIELINKDISNYNWEKNIPYLIERTDALVHTYELEINQIEHSLEHEVDYQRESKYAKEHSDFVKYHKSYRYLIEKLVQLKPSGSKILTKDEFQYLIALVDKLLEIYATSDHIHYRIYQAGIKVDDDYVTEITYAVDLASMDRAFGEEDAKIRLGLVGSEKDRVDSSRPVEEFLVKLDQAFTKELGFCIRSLVNILHVLSLWGAYAKIPEKASYSASLGRIAEVCLKAIKGLKRLEIPRILDFLTLKSENVTKLVGQQKPDLNIPVWEHRKRIARYTIKPLIKLNDKYVWAPYATRKAGTIWSQSPFSGQLPYDMESTFIQKVVEEEKNLIEVALVDKSIEVLKRFTPIVESNIDFRKRDKKGQYPSGLGDYDVLAYYPQKNTILNIEDKDILPAFCLKDAKKIRDERIFGRSPSDKGYLGKVENREEFLKKNIIKIAKTLNWRIKVDKLPKVVSLFISRDIYWWTKFPPRKTDVVFIRIDLLSQFLANLAK